jgi:hypothetical protein
MSGTTAAASSTKATTTPASSAAASAAAYNAVVQEYNGREIVFGANCEALPNGQIQPLGGKILLVNNSSVPHTIIFGNSSGVTVDAYHYRTAIVANSGVNIVSCDGVQKAATVSTK